MIVFANKAVDCGGLACRSVYWCLCRCAYVGTFHICTAYAASASGNYLSACLAAVSWWFTTIFNSRARILGYVRRVRTGWCLRGSDALQSYNKMLWQILLKIELLMPCYYGNIKVLCLLITELPQCSECLDIQLRENSNLDIEFLQKLRLMIFTIYPFSDFRFFHQTQLGYLHICVSLP